MWMAKEKHGAFQSTREIEKYSFLVAKAKTLEIIDVENDML